MTLFRVWVGVCVAMLAVTSASALTTISDHENPSGELDLYEIYNAVYETSFTASSSVGGMDALQVVESGVFTLAGLTGSASYITRYAGHDQRFGYYTNTVSLTGDYTVSGGGTSGDFNHLFDILTTGGVNLDNSGPSGTISGSPFGFYLIPTVPEPSTMALILMGIGGVAMRRRFSA